MDKKTESVNSREEAYCDGEPTESIREIFEALVLSTRDAVNTRKNSTDQT